MELAVILVEFGIARKWKGERGGYFIKLYNIECKKWGVDQTKTKTKTKKTGVISFETRI